MDGTLHFVALDPADLAGWLATTRREYVAERVAAGDTPAEAEANATASLGRLFPDGTPAPGQLVGRLVEDDRPVGVLWVGPAGEDPTRWWVWDVAVDEPHRGRGVGRRAMGLAEELARTHGATDLGLNVFAANTVARHLYASLGYVETSVQMRKSVAAPADDR